ncbi:hypothetical protein [Roseovarius confluentis]|uniref:hypothetical protein n=1 Tax=Roseovarius confluentis TaxID=1852027 RepID=UPI003CCC3FAE
MEDKTPRAIRRRGFLFFSVGGLVALAAPSVLRAQEFGLGSPEYFVIPVASLAGSL